MARKGPSRNAVREARPALNHRATARSRTAHLAVERAAPASAFTPQAPTRVSARSVMRSQPSRRRSRRLLILLLLVGGFWTLVWSMTSALAPGLARAALPTLQARLDRRQDDHEPARVIYHTDPLRRDIDQRAHEALGGCRRRDAAEVDHRPRVMQSWPRYVQ